MDLLKIVGYKGDEKGASKTGKEFVTQINPASIAIKHGVSYGGGDDNKATIIPQKKYGGTNTQTVSLELIVDTSGVLPDTTKVKSVKDQIELFKTVCYYYIGSKHEIPCVQILLNGESLFKYNNQAFFARIDTFDVTYTLFTPDGEPLRAKINASFGGTVDPKTAASLMDKQSPDLTHMYTVKAGDTLPMLCKQIYGDRQMHHEVARVNNLISFRYIEPGTELIFPPIK